MINVAENILKKNTENININEVDIIPCETGVLIEFYKDNPYRYVEQESNGLILGLESTHKYKSNETGEMEDSKEYIACAKVLAVGPKCKDVNIGEDVFCIKHIALPVPFRKKGWYIINESNIMCRIVNK